MNRFVKSLDEIVSHLSSLSSKLDLNKIEEAINSILVSKRVFVYGAGRSGLVAKAFAQRLMHIGIESYVVGETITPSMSNEDLFIIVSGSGETPTSLCLGRKAKEIGVKLLTVTAHPESELARISNITIVVPGKTKLVEKESYAPFTSLFDIAVLAVLDSITSELMYKLGVSEELISKKHANVE